MLPSETMYPYTAKEARERGELALRHGANEMTM